MVLDTRGLKCPRPLLAARRALANLPQGQELIILMDSPTSMADLRAFCQHHQQYYQLYELTGPAECGQIAIKKIS
jgi:TusA-related sulfurtransferase